MLDSTEKGVSRNSLSNRLRLGIFFGGIAVIIIIIYVAYQMGLADFVRDPNTLSSIKNATTENFVIVALVYVVCVIVGCSVLALPGAIYSVTAGVIFGPWWGTLLCSVSTAIGATCAFLLGRYFLKGSLEPRIRKNARLNRWLFNNNNTHSVMLLAITRFVPLFPNNLQNFAYGITNISLVTFSVFSLLFMLPSNALYTFAAAGVIDQSHRVAYLATAAVIAVAVVAICLVLSRHMHRNEDSTQDAGNQGAAEITAGTVADTVTDTTAGTAAESGTSLSESDTSRQG